MVNNIVVLYEKNVAPLKLNALWFMYVHMYTWQVLSLPPLDSLNLWCLGRHFPLPPCGKCKLYSVIDN